jgi:predicted phage terminase large subunit-like protein
MSMDARSIARSSPAGLAWWDSGGKHQSPDDDAVWVPAPHLLLLSQKLVDVATGRCPRLIVTMPPRHGKSELISKYAPAWFLGNFPHRKVMLASYADDFAQGWGRKAREVLLDNRELFGVELDPVTTGGKEWNMLRTREGRKARGVMTTAGVGGGLTGKGAHFLVIDDPVKNAEEAQSQRTRDAHWDWWVSTVRTRLQKGAGVVLVMTRWHEDDLAGRFLASDPLRDKDGVLLPEGERRLDVDGDHWELLNLPAFAEAGDPPADVREAWAGLDDSELELAEREWLAGWRDQIGRGDGDALWPDMFPAEWLEATAAAQGVYWFSAMYQQRPSPASGLHFKRDTFSYYDVDESGAERVFRLYRPDGQVELVGENYVRKFQTVDCAASEEQGADFTVVSTWGVTPKSDVLWLHMDRQRRDTTRMPGFVESCYRAQAPMLFMAIERLGHGLNAIQHLLAKGLPIVKLEADRDKLSRSIPAQVLYGNRKCFHPRHAHWLDDAEDELVKFPNGAHDDIVDTVSYMAIRLPFVGSGGDVRSGSSADRKGRTDSRAPVRRRRGRPLTAGLRDMES